MDASISGCLGGPQSSTRIITKIGLQNVPQFSLSILASTVPQFSCLLCPNSCFIVPQFWVFAVPQCSVFTVPQLSFLSCPNFRRGVPQSCPNFCCSNSLRKTDIHGQYKNWGTAAKKLGQELGHSKKRHLGHSKNRELGHSKNPELGHSKTRIGAQ